MIVKIRVGLKFKFSFSWNSILFWALLLYRFVNNEITIVKYLGTVILIVVKYSDALDICII